MTDNPTPDTDVVEAASKRMWDGEAAGMPWSKAPPETAAKYRRLAKAALSNPTPQDTAQPDDGQGEALADAAAAFVEKVRSNIYPKPDKPESDYGLMLELEAAISQWRDRDLNTALRSQPTHTQASTPSGLVEELRDSSMAPFKREDRYFVIKRKNLTLEQLEAVIEFVDQQGINTVDCVVVENDWPENELVWRMIEARVTGQAIDAFNATDHTELLREAADAVARASKQFNYYAKNHKAKSTPEADQKAAVNMGWSLELDELANRLQSHLDSRHEREGS